MINNDETEIDGHQLQLRTILLLGLVMIQRSCRISDRTILTIFLFIRSLLALIAEVLVLEPLSALVTLLPTTWYSIRKTLQLERRDYEMYAVCPKCHALYDLERGKAKVITIS